MNTKKNRLESQFDEMFARNTLKYEYDIDKMGRKDRAIAHSLLSQGVDGKVCLDIGPGTGRWLGFLQHHGADCLNAVDISSKSLERCESMCEKTQKVDLETDKLDFVDNSFDQIISIEVLEHIRTPDNFFHEIVRVAKNGAMVLISLPNISSLISRLRLLVGMLPVAISSDPTHVGFYRQKDISRMLNLYGQKPHFIPTSISLNPFNAKSRFFIPSNNALSSFDDSIVFSFIVKK